MLSRGQRRLLAYTLVCTLTVLLLAGGGVLFIYATG